MQTEAFEKKYVTVYRTILAKIEDGTYPPESQLPVEQDMQDMFNVSRGTVRKALDRLAQEGYIARRTGAGTFVLYKPQKAGVLSMTKQVELVGMTPGTKVLAAYETAASAVDPWVQQAYRIPREDMSRTMLYCIDRLKLGNDQPLARQIIYLMARRFGPDLLDNTNFAQSIFVVYESFNRWVERAEETLRARMAEPNEVSLLGMENVEDRHQLVYDRQRVSFDQHGEILEVMYSVERSDVFRSYHYELISDRQQLKPLER